MKILALNSGSSSIKYRLFDSDNNFQLLEQGVAERIGQSTSSITRVKENKLDSKETIFLPDHRKAMQALFPCGNSALHEIEAVGHRIVHGGELFKKPVLINKEVIEEITTLAQFAPLHCEPNIAGIEALRDLLPNIPQVAVFDTSAHAAMEYKAFLYGLPIEYYEKYKIRKYGFHGINHSYIALEAARHIKKPFEGLKIITCHLGNGCSISAFEKGKSIDNSMGFTPLEGVVMGTRCGDLDPSVVLYFIEKFGWQVDQVKDLLNKKSGLLGLCGKSDMRDIIEMAKQGDKYAQIAIDIFVYRIQKYIGGYVAALNGVDAIVFSGGIGENSPYIRFLIMKNFSYLGAHLDIDKNEKNEVVFSTGKSLLFLMNIPANEEKEIAKQVYQLLSLNRMVKNG
jgi:acetate kinase